MVLKQVGQLLKIGLCVYGRHEGVLKQQIKLFLLIAFRQLELLDQQNGRALVYERILGG